MYVTRVQYAHCTEHTVSSRILYNLAFLLKKNLAVFLHYSPALRRVLSTLQVSRFVWFRSLCIKLTLPVQAVLDPCSDHCAGRLPSCISVWGRIRFWFRPLSGTEVYSQLWLGYRSLAPGIEAIDMTELTPVLASLDPSIPPVEHIGYSRAHRAKTSLVGLDYGLYHCGKS